MNKWLIGLSLAALMAGPVHAGNAEAGKAKSAACAACHGVDGNSVNPEWPNLAGQGATYIAKQLSEFKSGVRKDPIMMGMAAPLSDEDMQDLAAYFASQTVKVGEAAADKVAAGEILYRGGKADKGLVACTACHGPTGNGVVTSGFPAVSGQHAVYIEKQLKAFASGDRANDANRMMRDIAAKLTADEMAAVAQYMQGLH
jgi:cytochrome c553